MDSDGRCVFLSDLEVNKLKKLTDIPKQYKTLNDEKVRDLFKAGRWLYAITQELGCDEYNVTSGDGIKITITKEGE